MITIEEADKYLSDRTESYGENPAVQVECILLADKANEIKELLHRLASENERLKAFEPKFKINSNYYFDYCGMPVVVQLKKIIEVDIGKYAECFIDYQGEDVEEYIYQEFHENDDGLYQIPLSRLFPTRAEALKEKDNE